MSTQKKGKKKKKKKKEKNLTLALLNLEPGKRHSESGMLHLLSKCLVSIKKPNMKVRHIEQTAWKYILGL